MIRAVILAALAPVAAAAMPGIPPEGMIRPGIPCYTTERLAVDMGVRGMWPAARGIIVTSSGDLLAQVWADHEGRWMWVIVNAHGQSCVVASGEMRDVMETPPRGEEM